MVNRSWDDTIGVNDCISPYSEWNLMVTYIKHSASCTFTIYDDEDSTNQKFKFTYAGGDSILEGGAVSGNDFQLKASTADAYPYIHLLGNGHIKFYSKDQFYFYDNTDQMLHLNRTTNYTYISGSDDAGDDFRVSANDSDTYPFIDLLGQSNIILYSYGDIEFYEQAEKMFAFVLNGASSEIYGSDDTGDDLVLFANSTDAYSYIKLDGAGDIALRSNADIFFYEQATQSFKFLYNANNSHIYGGAVSGDDITFHPSTADTYPNLVMQGANNVVLDLPTNKAFFLYEAGGQFFKFHEATDSIIETPANKNVYISPGGTGLLKYGVSSAVTHVANIEIPILLADGSSCSILAYKAP